MQSADLNPIKLVLDELHQKVRTKQPARATNHLQLLQKGSEGRYSVGRFGKKKKMPRIYKAIVAVKKGHFDDLNV